MANSYKICKKKKKILHMKTYWTIQDEKNF